MTLLSIYLSIYNFICEMIFWIQSLMLKVRVVKFDATLNNNNMF